MAHPLRTPCWHEAVPATLTLQRDSFKWAWAPQDMSMCLWREAEGSLALLSSATSEPFKPRDSFWRFRGSDPALDHVGNTYQSTQEVVQRVQEKSHYSEWEFSLSLLKKLLKTCNEKNYRKHFFSPTHLFRLFNSALDSSLHVACIPFLSSGVSISLVHISSSLRNNEDGQTFLKIMIQL